MHDVSNLVIDGTYLGSGWPDLLPQQATALHTLVNTATDHGIDGTIDDLAETVGWGWFDHFSAGLDSDVRWTHPKYVNDPETAEDSRRARLECIRAYSLSGIVLPATVRDLARSMADLGIFEVTRDGRRWRTVEWPPLPEERLAVSEEFRDAIAVQRWLMVHHRAAPAILDLLPARAGFEVSIDGLARLLDLPESAVRGGLEVLVRDRALALWTGRDTVVDPETVPADARVNALVRYHPFVSGEEPYGLGYVIDFDDNPDFDTLYENRFGEFDDAITPRMGYLLWSTAHSCVRQWHGGWADTVDLAKQLPAIARPLADDETWLRRFSLCFVYLENWFAGYQLEDVARCIAEQVAFHIVVDIAEAYTSDGVPDEAQMPVDLPDHGPFDLDFDRVRRMLDDHETTTLLAPGFDTTVERSSSLHPARWFVPLGSADDWEEE